MPDVTSLLSGLADTALAASAFGCLQAGVAVAALVRFRRRAAQIATRSDEPLPPVSLLKPLHGDEPLLEAALATMMAQDYGPMQLVLGVQDPGDPAVAVAQRLIAAHPGRDIALVIDSTPHGGNGKIGNLINMLPAARHELLVISDSDIHAPTDWLRRVVDALLEPGTGLVTTIYHGRPARPGFAERLAAAQINHNFLPGNLLARCLGRQDCLGATMALRRETLERIGGLRALLNHVADDGVLGRLVRGLGLRVALAPSIVATTVADPTVAAMLSHELRWGRTVRTQEPLGYGLSVLQLPLAWAALTVLAQPLHRSAWLAFVAVWAFRALAATATDRLAGAAPSAPLWALPLRDWLSALVMAGSFLSRQVAWRGRTFHIARGLVAADGRPHIDPMLDPVPPPAAPADPRRAAGLPQRGTAATTPRSAPLPSGSMRKTPV